MRNIKRWLVKQSDGTQMKLYFKTREEAEKCPWDIISVEEHHDNLHEKYVGLIKDMATEKILDWKGRTVYKIPCSDGFILVKLLFDKEDNTYYDYAEYQRHKHNQFTHPIGFISTTPKEFYKSFLMNPNKNNVKFVQHSMRFYGEPKLTKPKELKGIKQAFSVEYIAKKCKCPVFVHGDDVWIQHNDYFSEPLETEEVGAPLEYLANKYANRDKKKKFIYGDAWGSIVLRNQAWIKLENLAHRIERDDHTLSLLREILMQKERYLKFSHNELEDTYMARMYENVINETRKWLKESEMANENKLL